MTSGNNFLRGLLDEAGDLIRRVGRNLVDGSYNSGYEEAASVCLGVLSKNIDDLMNKIKPGSYLSDQEQFLLSKLTELKSTTERDLQDFRGVTAPDAASG